MQTDILILKTSMLERLHENENTPGLLQRYENAVTIISAVLQQVRTVVRGQDQSNIAEVIHLHKHGIPPIYAEYIYYASLHNLESSKPFGTKQKEFYLKELERIESWFNDHQDFLRYYRSDKNHLDENYFIPRSVKLGNYIDLFSPIVEDTLCTPFSFQAAMGKAYQRLQKDLARLMEESGQALTSFTSLYWSLSKTDLTELIYSLFASGAFNKGKATIKDITLFFEAALQIQLGNTSVTFQEILRRKDSTAFLDRLKENFDRHITNVEQKNIR